VECDTVIGSHYLYKGQPAKVITGGGGTCFDEPIKYANEQYLPDAVIYFTDGYAPELTIYPRKPILWLISANGLSAQSDDYLRLPGRKIKMNSESLT